MARIKCFGKKRRPTTSAPKSTNGVLQHGAARAPTRVIVGTKKADVLVGTPGPDQIKGVGGNDLICGGAGDDYILGGRGSDLVAGGPGKDSMLGEGGNDVLYQEGSKKGGPGSVQGGPGSDIIIGSPYSDYVAGNAGDDLIQGSGGDDQLFGDGYTQKQATEAGTDQLFGGSGNDQLEGGPEDDGLVGGENDDQLTGGPGNDVIYGESGQDWEGGFNDISGGPGDDRIYAGGTRYGYPGEEAAPGAIGNGGIEGGPGNDVITNAGCPTTQAVCASITAADGLESAVLNGGEGDDFLQLVPTAKGEIYGESGNDTLVSGELGDLLRGGAGTDSMFGNGGEDWCLGGSGPNDFCDGGPPIDTVAPGIVPLQGGGDNCGVDAVNPVDASYLASEGERVTGTEKCVNGLFQLDVPLPGGGGWEEQGEAPGPNGEGINPPPEPGLAGLPGRRSGSGSEEEDEEARGAKKIASICGRTKQDWYDIVHGKLADKGQWVCVTLVSNTVLQDVLRLAVSERESTAQAFFEAVKDSANEQLVDQFKHSIKVLGLSALDSALPEFGGAFARAFETAGKLDVYNLFVQGALGVGVELGGTMKLWAILAKDSCGAYVSTVKGGHLELSEQIVWNPTYTDDRSLVAPSVFIRSGRHLLVFHSYKQRQIGLSCTPHGLVSTSAPRDTGSVLNEVVPAG